MPAVGGVASVLGIKCVKLFSCACVHCFGEGNCDVQLDKDTNSGVEGTIGISWKKLTSGLTFFLYEENENERRLQSQRQNISVLFSTSH